MGKLVFRVASDWQEVVRLRTEIEKLKQTLLSMDSTQSPDAFQKLNAQLGESSKKLDGLVTEAAKAGAVMEGDFKKKIFDASQTVNGFTEKIISQKNAIKGFEQDLRALQEEYRKITKNGGKSQDGLDRIHRMKNIIAEEKDALFNLTQQQANARLSVKKLRDEYALYKNDGKQIVDTNQNIGISLKKALGVIGGIAALKQLGSEIIRVRGEFQSMQTAIETMVGRDVAGKLMPQIKELAKISPLTMTDMVGAEKMMLGFNIQAEDTIKYLKALSDISMGESSKFNSLTLAFSQMSAAGKLMGQDLNQMINAGFNPLQVIAEKTGKSIATLKEEMSKGAISAEMVQQAFIDATSAGGKFYGMSENASQTINGQISMMQDAWDNALNEIGKSSEGFIMSGIQATTSLIQNYETVGKVLVGLIATYGTYRTAVITNIALTRGWAVAARADAVAKGLQTIATKAQTVAQLALNSAMKANPYVLAATLIMGAASAMWALHDSTTAAEKAQKRFNDEQERFHKQQEDRKQRVEQLIRIIQDETETEYAKVKAYEELKTLSPTLTEAYTREQLAVASLTIANKKLNEEQDKQNYDNIIANVNKYANILDKARAEAERLRNEANTTNDIERASVLNNLAYGQELAAAKAEKDLHQWRTQLNEYNRIRKEIEESNKPVEVRLNAAKENEKNIKEALETIDDLILTKKREVEGHEIKIPLSSEGAAQEAESLENKVKNLKAKVEGDDIKIPFKPNEYLNKIPSLFEQERDNWVNMGMFTIPVSIELERNKITGLLSAAQKAVSALSGNSVQTYEEAYELAKKEWMAAKKALEESKKKSKDDYDKAKKELAVKEKAYKDLGGVTDKGLEKQDSEAEKQRKKQQKSAEELLSLRRQNQQDEINLMNEGSDKKLKQIELDYQKELDAIKKQERAWSKEQGGKLTQEQSVEISTRYTNAESKKDKSTADIAKEQLKEEAEAMRDYLKDYGTFQQQKLAIAQEYAEKIKKATSEGERLSLGKQRDTAIQQVDINALNQKIDWQSVFGNFSGILGSQLKETLDGLKEYIKTDKFKNSSDSDKKVIYEAIDRLREVTPGGEGTLNFNKIQQQMDSLGTAINKLQTATLNQEIAYQNLKKAEDNYADAIKLGDKGTIDNAKQALDLAKLGANAASDAYKSAEADVQNFGNNLSDVGADTVDGLDSVARGLQNFADGTLPGIFRGLQNTLTGLSKLNIGGAVGDAIGKLSQTLSSAGVIGQIISAILSILDILKDGIGPLISSIIDTVLNAINGILDNILSGDIFVQIFDSIKDGIGNILNTISFGGFNSLMDKISGSNAKEVQEAIDRLTSRNETLEKSIDRLSDIMDKTAGSKSISAYKQAYQYQQEHNANTLQIAREQARYSGSHHSWQKYMGWTDEQLQWARNNVDQSFSGTDSLWNLSPEQMRMLLSNADIYDHIKSAGKGGYGGRVLEKLEAYADNAEKLDELTTKINESLMQVSFDSLRDSFLDSLMDMNKDAKEFSDDFSEYMQRALLNFSLGEKFDDELKGWYNGIAELMKNQNGKLTEKQLEDARRAYDSLVQDAMNERDKIAEITGYTGDGSTSQESTKKGFAAASQDSIEELNGRFTALQIAVEEIKNQNIAQSQSLNILTVKADSILLVNTESRNIADEIRTIQVNSYLELQEIRENTGAIIKPIKDMAADIAEVKKNTSKL